MSAPMQRPARGGSMRGFTLMETLVMLMLVSITALLMFQMLGSYRIARARFVAQSGEFDRQSLFDAWFADSVRGLHAVPGQVLQGTATSFSGVSLNPLFGPPGAPARVEWTLQRTPAGDWTIRYVEDGTERWTLPLADAGQARFAYLDGDGKVGDVWPPASGMQDALPVSVALLRGDGDASRVQLATVRGPRKALAEPYEMEQF